MRRFALCLLVLGLSTAGCGNDQNGGGGSIGDLEWPPDATAHFDEHGILNADCASDEDCAMVLGYYHASERFVQMDVRRRFATGRLGDILIPPAAQAYVEDFADIRALFSSRDGVPLEDLILERASDKTRGLFDAYTVGVNKWLEELRNGEEGAIFPREFNHVLLDYAPEDIPRWTPKDCGASIIALVESLTNDETDLINAGRARLAIANDDKFSDLWSRRPLEESAILPLDWQPPSPSGSDPSSKRLAMCGPAQPLNSSSALERSGEKLQRTNELRRMLIGAGVLDGDVGSNSWVLDGSRTSSGNALLSNDPHLGMTQPATWYLAHLDARTHGNGDFHSAGVTFAGLPWILIGQNESIAWSMTNTVMDFTDAYIEEVVRDGDGNATGVMFKGEEVAFTRVPWTVTFSDGETHDFCDGSGCEGPPLLFVPHHGPVRQILSRPPSNPEDDVALTLRWTAQEISTDINFLTELNRASTLEEARLALENMTTVGQNVVVVDTDGNIGWFPYNRLPKRTWATNLDGAAPPWLPLDGGGEYEWDTYFELGELPQLVNPDDGYIATANNDMTGALFDGDPTTLPSGASHPPYQVSAASGFRHARIVDLIEEIDDQHTTATMDRIVSDVYSLIGEKMVPGMVALAKHPNTAPSLNGLKVISALEAWKFQCPTGLAGPYSDSALVTDAAELLESAGCAAFHALLNELRFRIELNEYAPSTYDEDARNPSFAVYYSIVDPSELVPDNKDVYWDDPGTTDQVETKYEVMAESLETVGDFLVGWLGVDETTWAWGRLHGLRLESDIGAFIGPDFDNPSPGEPLYANDGGLYTVDVAYPDPQDFVQTWGASTRFVCEALPAGPSCTIQLPGGQSSHIDSPNYEDLLFPYLRNEPMPLVFDIDQAAATAARTVIFQ